jgi:hypothetical protein
VVTPPNSSIMFAETAVIPVLKTVITPGTHWLMSVVFASATTPGATLMLPVVRRDTQQIHIDYQGRNWAVALTL